MQKKIRDLDKKISYTSGLVTTTVLNTKTSEVENKILNHDKYIATPEFNKLTPERRLCIQWVRNNTLWWRFMEL